jgi:hypothetical protein
MGRVLRLSRKESDLVRRYEAQFEVAHQSSGLRGWLVGLFRKFRPGTLSAEKAKVDEIHGRWKQAIEGRGRVPFHDG